MILNLPHTSLIWFPQRLAQPSSQFAIVFLPEPTLSGLGQWIENRQVSSAAVRGPYLNQLPSPFSLACFWLYFCNTFCEFIGEILNSHLQSSICDVHFAYLCYQKIQCSCEILWIICRNWWIWKRVIVQWKNNLMNLVVFLILKLDNFMNFVVENIQVLFPKT